MTPLTLKTLALQDIGSRIKKKLCTENISNYITQHEHFREISDFSMERESNQQTRTRYWRNSPSEELCRVGEWSPAARERWKPTRTAEPSLREQELIHIACGTQNDTTLLENGLQSLMNLGVYFAHNPAVS